MEGFRITLQEFFTGNPKVTLGFSGGVDSSYLLHAGLEYGADIKPYFINTAFQPAFELRDAVCLTQQLGVKLTVIEADILNDEIVSSNPRNRCYHCKQRLFNTLLQQAEQDGYPVVIDGSNASDDEADRPGMKALKELSIRSPLRECGLTKQNVRELSREAGLFTWDKPAYACLATRIPTGQAITAEMLKRIEQAENALFAMGFTDFRVRVIGDSAKLQFPDKQLEMAFRSRQRILTALDPFFNAVLLDLECR